MSDNVKPWDLINPNSEFVTDIVQKERYDICKNCEAFIKLTCQCKECGCFMKLKTKLQQAQCPLRKW